jgi:hypothetical protein
MVTLKKSYGLLNFLNRSHSPVFRQGLGAAAWAGTVGVTGRPAVAALVRRHFVTDETKDAFRLAGWVLRRGWPGIETVVDDFYDFTAGAEGEDLDALARFVDQRRHALPEHLWRSDDLFVRAARIHERLDAGHRDVSDLEAGFRERADALLDVIARSTPSSTTTSAPREGDFSLTDARRALADLADVLPVEEWRWYVISGTFLGLVREGGFLAHDYDIDVGIDHDAERVAHLVEVVEADRRFVVKKVDDAQSVVEVPGGYAMQRELALVKLIHESGINVDVFVHHRDGDVVWHGSSIHRWQNSVFELAPYRLEGTAVLGPQDSDRYLTENYGDWRTPVTEFNCTTGTPNLVVTRSFRSVALFLTRLAHFAVRDRKEYEKLRATLLSGGVLREDTGGRLRLDRIV